MIDAAYTGILNQNGKALTVGASGFTQAGGTFNGGGTLTVSGDWTVSAGDYVANSGTVTFAVAYAGTQTVTPGNVYYGDVSIVTGYNTKHLISDTLNVGGTQRLRSRPRLWQH